MIYALIGAVIMLVVLVGIGINQPRRISVKVWCYGYLAIAIVFDGLVILALVNQYAPLIETLLGLSAGAATGLAIHVAHHISEEGQHAEESGKKKEKTLFGF